MSRVSHIAVVASAHGKEVDALFSRIKASAQDASESIKRDFGRDLDAEFRKNVGTMADWFNTQISKMENRIAKGNFTPATENTLRNLAEYARQLDLVGQQMRALNAIDFGTQFRIPQLTGQVTDLNTALANTQRVISGAFGIPSSGMGTGAILPMGAKAPGVAGSTALTGQTRFLAHQPQNLPADPSETAWGDFYAAKAAAAAANQEEALRYQATLQNLAIRQRDTEDSRSSRLAAQADFERSTAADRRIIAAQEADFDLRNPRSNRTSARDLQVAARLLSRLEAENGAHYSDSPVPSSVHGPQRPDRYARGQRILSRAMQHSARDLDEDEMLHQQRLATIFGDDDAAAPLQRLRYGRDVDANGRRISTRGGTAFSHRFRFASQQVGFGIDDAIQSYQFGGPTAAFRAASNNITAMSGMLISNPVTAAVTTVALSLATVAAPMFFKKWETESRRDKLGDIYYGRDGRIGGAIRRGESMSGLLGIDSAEDTRISHLEKTNLAVSTLQKMGVLSYKDEDGNYTYNDSLFNDTAENRRARKAATKFLSTATDVEEENKIKFDEAVQKARFAHSNFNIASFRENIVGDFDNTMSMGLLTTEQDLRRQMIADTQRRKDIVNRSGRSQGGKEVANIQLDLALWEQLADDPAIAMSAATNRAANRAFHDRTRGGGLALETIRRQFLDESDSLATQAKFASGQAKETLTQRMRDLDVGFNRDWARGMEDTVEEFNPRKNPYGGMARSTRRRMESIKAAGLGEEDEKKLMLALLRGADSAAFDQAKPIGQRRWMTDGYAVGSRQDEELRARMLSSSVGAQKSQFDDSMTLKAIESKLGELLTKLDFQAKELDE